jgi:hypothetical protein
MHAKIYALPYNKTLAIKYHVCKISRYPLLSMNSVFMSGSIDPTAICTKLS